MRWLKPNLNSIYNLLGRTTPRPVPAAAFRTEAVRQMMLEALTSGSVGERHPRVFRRIFHAEDVHALWYARSDLMMVLASEKGETFAEEKIADISRLFDGLLPKTIKYQPRPSAGPMAKPGPPARRGRYQQG